MPDAKETKNANDPYDDPEYIADLEQMLSDMEYPDDFINGQLPVTEVTGLHLPGSTNES